MPEGSSNSIHWASVEKFLKPEHRLNWVDGEDATRVAAYNLYEAIYWTAPDALQITMRGQETDPIYVPSGRQIVETAHRFLAPGMKIVADPLFGTDAEQTASMQVLLDFLRREMFYSQFSANKREGLIKGDWLWHVFADPDRPEGRRVGIFPLDPGNYFPEYLEGDVTQIIAVHIAEAVLENGKPAVRKLIYRKESGVGGPSKITTEEALYDAEAWGQPGTDMDTKRLRVLQPVEDLPEQITAIPVYHFPNIFEPSFGWGSSEMRGVERLITAISQSVTDEDLTLVLEGLGVYTTDAGAPIDEKTGETVGWDLGPGRVVELPKDSNFQRVSGNGTVAPYLEHIKMLMDQLDMTLGSNDITRGKADVAVVESGIARMIRMAPLLARMTEKELILTDRTTQMLFDLRGWFQAYESTPGLDNIRWVPTYGDHLPVNKEEVFNQVMEMYNATPVPLISGQEARRMLAAIGYDFSDATELFSEILDEQTAFAKAQSDADLFRISQEASATGDVTGGANAT